MYRRFKLLLGLALALALPLRVAAATVLCQCAMHERFAATAHTVGAGAGDRHGSAHDLVAHDADSHSSGEGGTHRPHATAPACIACASCCSALWLPVVSSASPALVAAGQAFASFVALPVPDVVAGRRKPPPRRI